MSNSCAIINLTKEREEKKMMMFLLGMITMWIIIAVITCVWEIVADTWCDAYAIFVLLPIMPVVLLIIFIRNKIIKRKNKKTIDK